MKRTYGWKRKLGRVVNSGAQVSQKSKNFRFPALLLAIAALSASSARGQDCARADSALGPKTDGFVRSKYDKFTDSTSIISAREGDFTLFSVTGGAVISFLAQYKGNGVPTAPVTAGRIVVIADDGVESGLAKQTGAHNAKPDVAMAKYGQVEKVFVLVDDSTRLELPVVRHDVSIKQADGLQHAMVLETLDFTVTPTDLAKIGAGKKAAIRFGDNTKKISGRVQKSIREQARIVLCAQS